MVFGRQRIFRSSFFVRKLFGYKTRSEVDKEMDKVIRAQIAKEQEIRVVMIQLVNHHMVLMVKTHPRVEIQLILGLKNKFSKIWKIMRVNISINI
jgi:hypothetical protein